jgi:predicted helicase
MRALDFDEVQPDKTHNWVNLTSNDFETLMPLASKETKAAKTAGKERAIFKLFSLGVVTNRDEWVYDERDEALHAKVNFLVETYNGDVSSHQASANAANPHADFGTAIKWTRAVKADLNKGLRYTFDDTATIEACYRPFVKRRLYFHPKLNEMQYQLPSIFGRGEVRNPSIVISDATAQKPWMVCAVEQVPDLHFVGAAAGTVCMPVQRLAPDGGRADNITDWALKQFTAHYKEATATGAVKASASKARKITKEAIFHYCYAVLHDPVYREKYAQNLKREFPRIPLYGTRPTSGSGPPGARP